MSKYVAATKQRLLASIAPVKGTRVAVSYGLDEWYLGTVVRSGTKITVAFDDGTTETHPWSALRIKTVEYKRVRKTAITDEQVKALLKVGPKKEDTKVNKVAPASKSNEYVEAQNGDLMSMMHEMDDTVDLYVMEGSKWSAVSEENYKAKLGLSKSCLLHGSSSDFSSFKPGTIFLTREIAGAAGFASLGEYFFGLRSKDKTWVIQVAEPRNVKLKVVNQKEYPQLFDRSKTPEDKNCQEFVEDKNNNCNLLHFTGAEFSDAGCKDVWFAADPKIVPIVKSIRCFQTSDEYMTKDDLANGVSKFILVKLFHGATSAWKPVKRI